MRGGRVRRGVVALATGIVLALPAASGAAPRGAILVLVDTLRADHVGYAGYERPTSPALDGLAKQGVVFEQAIAYSSWTLPSAVALFSGRWGDRRAYDTDRRKLRRSFAEHFQAAGVRTAAFTEGGYVSRHFGFQRGFETYVEEEGPVRLVVGDAAAKNRRAGSVDRTFRQAIQWLRSNKDERFFLVIHTYEPHTPYQRHHFAGRLSPGRIGPVLHSAPLKDFQTGKKHFAPSEIEYMRALYDGGILETDRHLARLLGALSELGLSGQTVVAVSSDHGEELGDHYLGFSGDHGHSLYDELVRVPLVIRDPTRKRPVTRVKAQVRSIDILPTLADLMGLPRAMGVEGQSLAPLMNGTERQGRIAYGGAVKVAPRRNFVRHLGWKYIEAVPEGAAASPLRPRPAPVELYDLTADPGERKNLAAEQPETVERFRAWLAAHRAEARGGAPQPAVDEDLPEELRERLRSLGYVE
ncbi:MAG: sulfatase [Myxococcota bacterium]